MRARVLAQFSYSADGINSLTFSAGDVLDVKDDLAPGLIAAGLIKAETPGRVVSGSIAPIDAEKLLHRPKSDPGVEDLEVVRHIGRGRYAVFRGGERLTHDALTKDQADAALAAMR